MNITIFGEHRDEDVKLAQLIYKAIDGEMGVYIEPQLHHVLQSINSVEVPKNWDIKEGLFSQEDELKDKLLNLLIK